MTEEKKEQQGRVRDELTPNELPKHLMKPYVKELINHPQVREKPDFTAQIQLSQKIVSDSLPVSSDVPLLVNPHPKTVRTPKPPKPEEDEFTKKLRCPRCKSKGVKIARKIRKTLCLRCGYAYVVEGIDYDIYDRFLEAPIYNNIRKEEKIDHKTLMGEKEEKH